MFDRPYSRTLEAEADKVGLQFAAKVTTTDWFYSNKNKISKKISTRHFSVSVTVRGSFILHMEVNCKFLKSCSFMKWWEIKEFLGKDKVIVANWM